MTRNSLGRRASARHAPQPYRHLGLSLATLAAALLALSPPTAAQLAPWGAESGVLVDMSVLGGTGGGGTGRAGGTLLLPLNQPAYSGDLMLPPPQAPRSRLLVRRAPSAGQPAGAERITLKPPKAKPKRRARPARRVKPTAKIKLTAPAKKAKGAEGPAMALKPKAKKPARKKTLKKKSTVLAKLPPAVKLPAPPAISPPPTKPAAAKQPTAKAKPAPVKAPKQAPASEQVPALTPPPAPPPPSKAKAAKPRPAQQAALPPTPKKQSADLLVISFKPGTIKLTAAEKKRLAGLIARMKASKGLRLQLQAFAGEAKLSASKARRLSLSRALTVRSHLIDKGVRSTRIDVRALGNRVGKGPPSRVDLRLTQR